MRDTAETARNAARFSNHWKVPHGRFPVIGTSESEERNRRSTLLVLLPQRRVECNNREDFFRRQFRRDISWRPDIVSAVGRDVARAEEIRREPAEEREEE
jgi:hypothetical protein